MINPIIWLRAEWSDFLWYRAFNRAPIQILGELLVKEVKGSFYCVGTVDDITVKAHN